MWAVARLIAMLGCTPDAAGPVGAGVPPGQDPPIRPPETSTQGHAPSVVGGPVVRLAGDGVYLTRSFEIRTDEPTRLTLTVAGPDEVRQIRFEAIRDQHQVPLLGLRAETTYEVRAELTGAGGWLRTGPSTFTTEALPPLPTIEAHRWEPERVEPGLTLFPLVDLDADVGWLVALDAAGEVVHLRDVPARSMAVAVLPDGGIALNESGSVAVYEPLGGTRRRWTSEPSAPEDVPIDVPDLHHELLVQPDGSFFSLSARAVAVPEYPTSYDEPFAFAPATISEDLVVHVAHDGTTLATYPLGDLLDVRRIGFDALGEEPSELPEWSHANGLHYDASADQLLVSLRHQDAVVAFDRATGDLRWIFAPPFGWPPELQPYLLTATAPFVWPTHQHGIELDPDGILRMFDNGTYGRDTPYHDSGQAGDDYSRIFEVSVDAVNRTATPAAEYVETTDGPWYARGLGNADRLPATGNRLGTWGTTPRIVEFADDGDVVFEVRVTPWGWRSDRAIRVPSLYGRDVAVEVVDPR